jgi:hypothetical protein
MRTSKLVTEVLPRVSVAATSIRWAPSATFAVSRCGELLPLRRGGDEEGNRRGQSGES